MRRLAPALVALLCLTASTRAQAPESFERYAVAADHTLASQAGAEILAAGGNAADAAAATMLTLGVVSPGSSGLGGGGLALYYEASTGRVTFLDFRERAPQAATPDMFANAPQGEGPASTPSQLGGLATGVPGEPAGIAQLVRRFGSKPLSEIAAPAIRHAQEGFEVTEYVAMLSEPFGSQMRRDPGMRRWFERGATQLRPGQTIRNRELARTLRAFAADGAEPFYRGRIAREIVRQNRRNGGILTQRDLELYQVVERAPLQARRIGYRWVTAPPPSAGGYTLLAALGALERFIPAARIREERGHRLMHAFAESFKGPYWDRMRYFGDPDHVDVPTGALLRPERLDRRASVFRPTLAMPISAWALPLTGRDAPVAQPPADHGTSHLCVVDGEGNVAAITTTINLPFGARYSAAGMVMNDEMDDFATSVGEANAFGLPGGEANLPGPGRRPVSSMTPTIVFDEEGPVLCVGAAGGSRIPTATLQVAWYVLARGFHPHAALRQPRVHHQGLPAELGIEELFPVAEEDLAQLRARGHQTDQRRHSAVVQVIRMREAGPQAGSDPRKGAVAAGR